ncbi:TPA: DUF4123 domain-containing protein [Proteus mirabilis]|nr:DUF4123 domain-containing protein [Proteus mirabilis]HEK2725438.1 DUF4123 domain-containing protein [Proteus mirabilis]
MNIITQFHEAYPIHAHTHAIIDRIIYPDLPREWDAMPIVTEVTSPQEHLYPYLIELKNIESESLFILEKIISESKEKAGILLIRSSFDKDTLKSLLANNLIYSLNSGDNYFLRYYDYHVLLQLIRILTSIDLFSKFKSIGVDYVTFYSSYGNRTYIPINIIGEVVNETPILNRLLNIGIINISIKKLNKKLDIIEYFRLSDFLENKITIARNDFSLTNMKDICAFITHSILIHEFYYHSPQVDKILKEAKNCPGYFCETLALVSNEDWDNILRYCEKYEIIKE